MVPPQPAADAGPEAIVQGFLQAMQAGSAEEFASARQYLTTRAAQAWKPSAAVQVYAASTPPVPEFPDPDQAAAEEGTEPAAPGQDQAGAPEGELPEGAAPGQSETRVQVEVAFDQVGAVDEVGRHIAIQPTPTVMPFTVETDTQGRWRISEPPQGVLLSDEEFGLQYRMSTLYFPDQAGEYMVPDVRWFPREAAARNTVEAFIAGPPEWLAGAVANPVPEGTVADVDAVAVHGQTVTVSLTGAAVNATPDQRELILACLTASLTRLPDLREVEVNASTLRWTAGGHGDRLIRDPPAEGNLNYLDAGPEWLPEDQAPTPARLMEFADGAGLSVAGYAALANTTLTSLAVLGADRQVAGIDGHGRIVRLAANTEPEVLAERAWGVAPAFDRHGFLWAAASPDSETPGLTVYPENAATPLAVAADWLRGREVLAVAPSREGARLAVVSRDQAGGVNLEVAAVARGEGRVPTALGEPIAVASFPVAPGAVAWADEVSLAVLASAQPEVAPTPRLVTVGGTTTELRSPGRAGDPAVAVASGVSVRDVYAGTASGELFLRSGPRWVPVAVRARLPAFPP
jgi:hypothetical protein